MCSPAGKLISPAPTRPHLLLLSDAISLFFFIRRVWCFFFFFHSAVLAWTLGWLYAERYYSSRVNFSRSAEFELASSLERWFFACVCVWRGVKSKMLIYWIIYIYIYLTLLGPLSVRRWSLWSRLFHAQLAGITHTRPRFFAATWNIKNKDVLMKNFIFMLRYNINVLYSLNLCFSSLRGERMGQVFNDIKRGLRCNNVVYSAWHTFSKS